MVATQMSSKAMLVLTHTRNNHIQSEKTAGDKKQMPNKKKETG